MNELFVKLCGVSYDHKKGTVYKTSSYPSCYLFTYFTTDFIAETRYGLRQGCANSFILFEPNTSVYHSGTPKGNKGFCDDWIFFYGKDVKRLIEEMDIKTNVIIPVENGKLFTELISSIQYEFISQNSFSQEKISAYLTLLLAEIAQNTQSKNMSAHFNKISDIRNEMLKSYDKKWTVNQLASLAGYSTGHFALQYRQKYGVSPIEDLINYRLIQSTLMLKSNTLSINDISKKCGFSSCYYYSRIFKQKYGISPLKYRKGNIP